MQGLKSIPEPPEPKLLPADRRLWPWYMKSTRFAKWLVSLGVEAGDVYRVEIILDTRLQEATATMHRYSRNSNGQRTRDSAGNIVVDTLTLDISNRPFLSYKGGYCAYWQDDSHLAGARTLSGASHHRTSEDARP